MRKLLRTLATVLQGGLALVAIMAAAILTVPPLLGWEVMTVLSGSMAPTYPPNAVVVAKPIDPSQVEVGDVVAFMPSGAATPVTHRVVGIEGHGSSLAFVTKGDNNEEADRTPVPAAAVRGLVVGGIPMVGHLVQAVRTPTGFALLVMAPIAALLVGSALSAFRRTSESAPLGVVPAATVGVTARGSNAAQAETVPAPDDLVPTPSLAITHVRTPGPSRRFTVIIATLVLVRLLTALAVWQRRTDPPDLVAARRLMATGR